MRKDDTKIQKTEAEKEKKDKQTAYQQERDMQLQINRYNEQNKEGDYD